MNSEDIHSAESTTAVFDTRSFMTWIATGLIGYQLLSGLAIALLPFGVFVQYSVLVHSVVGLLAIAPILLAIFRHRRRRDRDLPDGLRRSALGAFAVAVLTLLTGLLVALTALFGTSVPELARTSHLIAAVAVGVLIVWHLLPLGSRPGAPATFITAAQRRRYAATGAVLAAILFAIPVWLTGKSAPPVHYQAFDDQFDWPYGEDHPFWPSRAALADPPWKIDLLESLHAELSASDFSVFESALTGPRDQGIEALVAGLATSLELDAESAARVTDLAAQASLAQQQTGALIPSTLTGSATCGNSGCHQAIYEEWRASAHGFAAEDILFLQVQRLLADAEGPAATRSCAGCHDPAALFSGARHPGAPMGDDLTTFEGNSCLVCHTTVRTDTEGNGGYVLQPPDRFLYEEADSGMAAVAGRFLIRTQSEAHRDAYSRPLYRQSEFCAGCHKQIPAAGEATAAGFAQEQNEYDSWKQSRWYHGEDDPRTIQCRECHMPLVASDDPAAGDEADAYRSSNDGMHRSHRVLASNMYIPMHMDIPGGDEQARLTIDWLQGKIDVPEIVDRWAVGPVVNLEIVAPDEIAPGELVNLKLHLHNHRTGHDFPAGPLDVLESWVELTVEDNQGNTLLELGAENSASPSIDAPVVYKADWYDRQGLPVDRHDLWEVVGASYRRVIQSGGTDVIDVPFRCPGIARPRLSESASESGPGERSSDVVFSIAEPGTTELIVTARLLFRKANPEFLAAVYELEPLPEAPIIELDRDTFVIAVVAD